MNSIVVFLSFVAVAFAGKEGGAINHPAKGGRETTSSHSDQGKETGHTSDQDAEEATPVDLEELREVFDVFDTDHNNEIDAKELENILSAFNFKGVNPKDAPAMLKARDTNGDGVIDFDEFVVMMTVDADNEKTYGEIFDEYANGKTEVSVEEMVKIMKKIGIEVTPAEIQEFAGKLGGHSVTRPAFIAYMSRQPGHGSSQSVPNHASATPHSLPATSDHHPGGKHH